MPFPHEMRGVASLLKTLCKGHLVERKTPALRWLQHVRLHASVTGIAACEQRGSARRAQRLHIEVIQHHRAWRCSKCIQVRRQRQVSCHAISTSHGEACVCITDIIRDQQQNVGPPPDVPRLQCGRRASGELLPRHCGDVLARAGHSEEVLSLQAGAARNLEARATTLRPRRRKLTAALSRNADPRSLATY